MADIRFLLFVSQHLMKFPDPIQSGHKYEILHYKAGYCKKNIQSKIFRFSEQDCGKLTITSCNGIACKYLFTLHFDGLFPFAGDKQFEIAHTTMIELCLRLCDFLIGKSIAFPALGTGKQISYQKYHITMTDILTITWPFKYINFTDKTSSVLLFLLNNRRLCPTIDFQSL